MTRIKLLILLTILAVFGLHSCEFNIRGTWQDENIEQTLRSEIQTLDKNVLEAITTRNSDLMKTVMSDNLLEKSVDDIDQLIERVGSVILNADYRILNQFYVKNSTTGAENTVKSGVGKLNDYIINYQAPTEEMFISIIISKNVSDEIVLINIYGKYPDGWKLNILQYGQYKVNGQTAPELYSKAKEKFEKGYLIDAAHYIFLCSKVVNPARKVWQYQKENEILSLLEEIRTSISNEYIFPLTLDEIDSKPQILAIYPQRIQEGYFPMIEYVTNIDLKDTVRTKAENDKIHNVIGHTFRGINKGKKFILYKAFSQMPDGKTSVSTYESIKELD